jgi:hypothetical protein
MGYASGNQRQQLQRGSFRIPKALQSPLSMARFLKMGLKETILAWKRQALIREFHALEINFGLGRPAPIKPFPRRRAKLGRR